MGALTSAVAPFPTYGRKGFVSCTWQHFFGNDPLGRLVLIRFLSTTFTTSS
jgi:hypothetical protein